jgi:spermidine/putrescine transport system substrate-binding protein
MLQHPKDRPNALSRREFLRRSAAAGVALPGLAAILAACGTSSSGTTPEGSGASTLQLARPNNPVTLPTSADNPPIADNLKPESGPLKIFGYTDYIWKKVQNQFSAKYGADIQYTVFDTPEEMVSKMQSNGADFDLIVTVTLENIGKLATAGLIQPLNHNYLGNVQGELWTAIPDFYDVGRNYSIPYVVYGTGISWRNDLVSEDIGSMGNPYDVFWDTTYKGQAHILNGSRDMLAVGLLRDGYDPNESDPAILDKVKQEMLAGDSAMGWRFDHVDYTELSTNGWKIHNTWSGQMVYYQYYLPKGLPITSLSYIWPPQGAGAQKGLITHDLFCVPKGAKNPVLAHAMIDYLYDPANALANYTYEGYQPPVNSLDVGTAVSKGYLPKSLDYTFITQDMLPMGVTELELAPAVNQLYQEIYQEVTGGA